MQEAPSLMVTRLPPSSRSLMTLCTSYLEYSGQQPMGTLVRRLNSDTTLDRWERCGRHARGASNDDSDRDADWLQRVGCRTLIGWSLQRVTSLRHGKLTCYRCKGAATRKALRGLTCYNTLITSLCSDFTLGYLDPTWGPTVPGQSFG